MSFILDALKKSESDRQRQGGPALFEVKVAPPRHALPLWAVAIAVLFLANLGVVGWLLLRHAAAPAATPAAVTARAPAHTETEGAPLPAPAAAPAAAAPAVVALKTPAAVAPPAVTPTVRDAVTASPAPNVPQAQAESAAAASANEPSNPDDLAPAVEPPPSGSFGRVKRGTDAGVPLYQQLAATPGSQLPKLRLDLHAYAARAEDRWVLVNMHKLREGDSLEGAHVDRITPDGAVLSYQGSQFLLTRE